MNPIVVYFAVGALFALSAWLLDPPPPTLTYSAASTTFTFVTVMALWPLMIVCWAIDRIRGP